MSTNHDLFEEKGQPKRNRAEAPLLTSLTAKPNRLKDESQKEKGLYIYTELADDIGKSRQPGLASFTTNCTHDLEADTRAVRAYVSVSVGIPSGT